MRVFLCAAYSTKHHVLQVHPCCGMCQTVVAMLWHVFKTEQNIIVCIHHILHSSTEGHPGRFHLLVVGNEAAMATGAQIALQDPGFHVFQVFTQWQDYQILW